MAMVSHALHEEILKHKKDAVEWGVLVGGGLGGGASVEDGGYRRNQRGPRRLKGVWRDWMEFRDYGPRLEVLTSEELERREVERERASRCVSSWSNLRMALNSRSLSSRMKADAKGDKQVPANWRRVLPRQSARTTISFTIRGVGPLCPIYSSLHCNSMVQKPERFHRDHDLRTSTASATAGGFSFVCKKSLTDG